MQDWLDQARKNNLTIQERGRCQLCSSRTEHGVAECVELASQVAPRVDHSVGVEKGTIFLSVDCHALQHSEIHGRWNNHFHLTRLNLILTDGVRWNYRLSPVLSAVVNQYKEGRDHEFIMAPNVGSRGALTVSDILDTSSEEEYVLKVWAWARQVYASYSDGHGIVQEVSRLFRARIA